MNLKLQNFSKTPLLLSVLNILNLFGILFVHFRLYNTKIHQPWMICAAIFACLYLIITFYFFKKC